METRIGTLIQASKRPTNTPCAPCKNEWSDAAAAFKTSYPSPSDVERAYNPANWGYAAAHPAKAYEAHCPTLREMDAIYGSGAAANWIDMQVSALFGASSKADTELANSIGIFADTFAAEVRAYKLSELMLFFARYKAGVYDNSYATFDTRRIGNAFFKEFLPRRAYEVDMLERRRIEQEQERMQSTPVERDHEMPEWMKMKLKLNK